ncbi:Pre-mRNA cleavage complex 2 protein Pcf11 [Liparis tanakae]|uniref:Pre-mRNA cleavage complex 2 protein Pcf11 n=1 Tax=Liparis tanakae TaxID=230148 RepID=A0A4Z2G634_9TELE|nr:Pre-mRNA cleavage complex 2 protein Pcf11 [Liparis tanakae]
MLIDSAAVVGFPGSLGSKMADEAACEDACREYQSSLEDLTFNSKPHINMLTILAEENLNFAKDIVDENTRKSLFKLRSTWDDVFPLKKLFGLDARVNALDPAWPIKPLPPTVNASIHVNPKFLKQPEDAPSPQPAPTKPAPAKPAPAPAPVVPAPQPVPVPVSAVVLSQSSLTQEQLIRQQLLAKQKQLLELQQKKIELELQQTNEQLGGGFAIPSVTRVSSSVKSSAQPSPAVRSWAPPPTPADAKPPTRDPRLNRAGPPHKELHAGKKDGGGAAGSPAATPEKSARSDRVRTPRKDPPDDKKSKPPSPVTKGPPGRTKTEAEVQKSSDGTKKDPRLKKRPQDKTGDAKEEELKEKKRCGEKEREEAPRPKPKLANGSKHDRAGSADKTGGNARTHARKRTRSRSRSRSPLAASSAAAAAASSSSPKRKDRRSPKSRTRSSSLSPSHKAGKPRRPGPAQGDRPPAKKNPSESRRAKRPAEDRHAESRDGHEGGGGAKEVKEPPQRWRSGWEENKQ